LNRYLSHTGSAATRPAQSMSLTKAAIGCTKLQWTAVMHSIHCPKHTLCEPGTAGGLLSCKKYRTEQNMQERRGECSQWPPKVQQAAENCCTAVLKHQRPGRLMTMWEADGVIATTNCTPSAPGQRGSGRATLINERMPTHSTLMHALQVCIRPPHSVHPPPRSRTLHQPPQGTHCPASWQHYPHSIN
jgi:hypothetical protein